MAVIPASLRCWRSPASSPALSPLPAAGSTGAPTTMPPASLATSAALTPPGSAATTRASPPAAGSSQSAATSPLSPFLGWPGSGGRARPEMNSSDPSGRKRGLPSPSADRVSRRAGPPCGSIRQMLVRYFFLPALSACTAAASQVPSGASRSAATRGSATNPARSWKGVEGVAGPASALTVSPALSVDKPQFRPYPAISRQSLTARSRPPSPGGDPCGQLASVIMAAPTVAFVLSSIRMRPPVVRFLA